MSRVTPASKLMGQLRFLICECYDNGSVLEQPKFYRINKIEDNERVWLMLGMTRLMMNTDYCCKATKIWLSNPYITMSGVAIELAKSGEERVSDSTVQSRVFYDSKRICKDFSTDVVTDICEVLSNPIDKYAEILRDKNIEYRVKSFLDEIDLKLNNVAVIEQCDISDEQFNQFIDTIYPYIKRVKDATEASLDSQLCYYINRLANGEVYNDRDKCRLNDLISIVYGQENVGE